MLINSLVGGVIFGYAGWTIIWFYQKSKLGKCAGCALEIQCKANEELKKECLPSE